MSLNQQPSGWREPSVLRSVLTLLGGAMMFAWVAIPMMGDWFGATGAAIPRPEIGHSYFVKGIQASGYGTAEQATFLKVAPLVVMASLLGLGGLAHLLGLGGAPSSASQRGKLSVAFWFVWFALLLGGGHWIALVLTGSWSLPNHLRP